MNEKIEAVKKILQFTANMSEWLNATSPEKADAFYSYRISEIVQLCSPPANPPMERAKIPDDLQDFGGNESIWNEACDA